MLVSGVGEYYPDKILVAGSGMAGYGRSNEIVTRKINEHFYLCGDAHTEPVKGRGLWHRELQSVQHIRQI